MYKVYGGLSLSLCWIEWPWNKLAIMHVHCHFHRLSTSTNQNHCGTLTYASGKTDLLRRIGYRSFISSALTSVSSASCVNTYLSIITTIYYHQQNAAFFTGSIHIVFDSLVHPTWTQTFSGSQIPIPNHSTSWKQRVVQNLDHPTVSPFFENTSCFFRLSFAASIVSSTAGESTDLPKLSLWVRHQGKQISKSGCFDGRNPANHLGCMQKTHSNSIFEHSETWPSKNVGGIGPYVYVVLFELHPIQYPSIAVTPPVGVPSVRHLWAQSVFLRCHGGAAPRRFSVGCYVLGDGGRVHLN